MYKLAVWTFLLLILMASLQGAGAQSAEWLSADIGFFPDSNVEQIQAIYLADSTAEAIDAEVSADIVAHPQRITNDRTTQSTPPVRATGLNNLLILPCAFADQPIPTLRDNYFSDMRDELRLYWRELSYDQLDIGESEITNWYTLPLTLEAYQQMDITSALTLIFEQCTAAADLEVDFSDIAMINILLNESLGASWAGQRQANLDGTFKLWPITWNMDWAWERSGRYTLKHEMGHLFGMSHSMGKNGSEYGNSWDTMSHSLSQHTIGYNKMQLGWLDSAEIAQVNSGTTQTYTLSALASPVAGVKLLTVPVVGSETDLFTVEFRQIGGYDKMIIGTSIVIHEIDYEREIINPISHTPQIIPVQLSQFTQESIHNGDSLWEAGETFISPEGVQIHISAIDTDCADLLCGTATVTVTNPGYTTFLPTVRR